MTAIDRPYVDFPAAPVHEAVTPERVLETVARAFRVPASELVLRDRHLSLARARLVAYWALRTICRLPYPRIGGLMNGRNHCTVILGVQKVERWRAEDPEYAALLDRIAEGVRAA